jgi:two-component system LytT family response regulator
MRALIVDDEPVARKVLREELEALGGIEVAGEADNGETALLEISSISPDIVFLDIQMPVMGGVELLDRLNKRHRPIVIMVTAYDQYVARAFAAGAVDCLLKPISQRRLAQAIEHARKAAAPVLPAHRPL